jgi:molybdate transport system permease protein
MDMGALLLTLRLAGTTTLVLLAIAVPLAWWIAQGGGWWRALVQALAALPLVLPPTVLGFYLLVLLGPTTAPGRLIVRVLGHPLAFSFSGLVVGSILYSFPFAVQPLVAGFAGVGREFVEAAAGLGVSPAVAFLRVVLPMSARSVVTAAVLTFTHTVGEFGVVLMLGGNLPGATQTLSIVLFDQVQDFDYAAANRTAGVLVGLSLAALLVVYGRQGFLPKQVGDVV